MTKAQSSLDLYQEAFRAAEKAARAAAAEVTGLLRGELQRRARAAQTAYDRAVRDFEEAGRARVRASEEMRNASGTAQHFPSEDLKSLFSAEIAACHETAKASA